MHRRLLGILIALAWVPAAASAATVSLTGTIRDFCWTAIPNVCADHPDFEESWTGLAQLGIAPGNSYAFDLFFAERRRTQSNFTVSTTLALVSTPEPTQAALLAWGLGALALIRSARRSR